MSVTSLRLKEGDFFVAIIYCCNLIIKLPVEETKGVFLFYPPIQTGANSGIGKLNSRLKKLREFFYFTLQFIQKQITGMLKKQLKKYY